MKSNSVMSCDRVGGLLVWTYSDGKKLEFDPTKAGAVREDAEYNGWKQKIADAAAISRDSETGKPATVAAKREAMEAVVANLYAGQWNATREGSERSSQLFDAVMAHYAGKKSADAVRKYLKDMSKEQRDALAETDAIRKQIDKIRRAKVKASGINGEDLLAKMPD